MWLTQRAKSPRREGVVVGHREVPVMLLADGGEDAKRCRQYDITKEFSKPPSATGLTQSLREFLAVREALRRVAA